MSRYAKPASDRDASRTALPYWLMIPILALGLAGCAATPDWTTEDVDDSVTPAVAAAEGETVAGTRVQWGGVIVSVQNLEEGTAFEVLAYPLDRRARPRLEQDPYGRVVVEYDQFVEPVVYERGRELSAVGRITAPRTVEIGETRREVPAVAAEELHLWEERQDPRPGSRVQFGIGIGIIR